MVGRPVGADQAGAVEAEDDRQVLERDLLEDLVVRALEERAVDVDDRPGAGLGHAGGEGDGVALADARRRRTGSGNVSRIFWSLFPSHMAAVITATLGSRRQASNSASLTASV